MSSELGFQNPLPDTEFIIKVPQSEILNYLNFLEKGLGLVVNREIHTRTHEEGESPRFYSLQKETLQVNLIPIEAGESFEVDRKSIPQYPLLISIFTPEPKEVLENCRSFSQSIIGPLEEKYWGQTGFEITDFLGINWFIYKITQTDNLNDLAQSLLD